MTGYYPPDKSGVSFPEPAGGPSFPQHSGGPSFPQHSGGPGFPHPTGGPDFPQSMQYSGAPRKKGCSPNNYPRLTGCSSASYPSEVHTPQTQMHKPQTQIHQPHTQMYTPQTQVHSQQPQMHPQPQVAPPLKQDSNDGCCCAARFVLIRLFKLLTALFDPFAIAALYVLLAAVAVLVAAARRLYLYLFLCNIMLHKAKLTEKHRFAGWKSFGRLRCSIEQAACLSGSGSSTR